MIKQNDLSKGSLHGSGHESCPYMEELHNMHNDEIKNFKCENDFEKWFENDMGRLKPILRTWIEQDEIRRKSNS